MAYVIDYGPEAQDHLRKLTASQRALVTEAVDQQLRHQPTVETRNRKRMRVNFLAHWELRVRNLRVLYIVEEEPEPVVRIRAIGIKKGNRIRIDNEEVDLE